MLISKSKGDEEEVKPESQEPRKELSVVEEESGEEEEKDEKDEVEKRDDGEEEVS